MGPVKMTVGAPGPHAKLRALAEAAGALSILGRLKSVSLPTDTKSFVGIFVSNLAQRERIGVLAEWAPENTVAAELELLGRAAWGDIGLLRSLRPVGEEHLVGRQLHGFMTTHYLAALMATRRALGQDRVFEPYVERLRLLLLIRAVEAADQGILIEGNLATACATVRQIADKTAADHWAWIKPISHDVSGFENFVSESRFQLQRALSATGLRAPEKHFYTCLVALLDKRFRQAKSRTDGRQQPDEPAQFAEIDRTFPVPAQWPSQEADLSGHALHLMDGPDESRTFAFAELDVSRPPTAQREQGSGVILQSLEDSQYLRHSWHRLSRLEERAFEERALQLMADGHSAVDRLGAALTAVAALTSRALSGLGAMQLSSTLTDDWTLDAKRGALLRRPPRFPRRWKASEASAAEWIRPLSVEWRIELTEAVKAALTTARGSSVDARGELTRSARSILTHP